MLFCIPQRDDDSPYLLPYPSVPSLTIVLQHNHDCIIAITSWPSKPSSCHIVCEEIVVPTICWSLIPFSTWSANHWPSTHVVYHESYSVNRHSFEACGLRSLVVHLIEQRYRCYSAPRHLVHDHLANRCVIHGHHTAAARSQISIHRSQKRSKGG